MKVEIATSAIWVFLKNVDISREISTFSKEIIEFARYRAARCAVWYVCAASG